VAPRYSVLLKLSSKVFPIVLCNIIGLFILQVFFAQRMTLSTYGSLNFWLAWVTVFAVFVCYLFNAASQALKQHRFKQLNISLIAGITLIVSFILMATLNFGMLCYVSDISTSKLVEYGLWLLPLFLLLNLNRDFMQSHRFNLQPAKYTQLIIYFMVFFLGLCLLDESKVLTGSLGAAAVAIAMTIALYIQFWTFKKNTSQHTLQTISNKSKRIVKAFSVSYFLANMGPTILLQSSVIMVYLLLGSQAAGLFAAAASIALLIDIPRTTITAVAARFVIGLHAEQDPKALQLTVDRVARLNFYTTLIFFAGVIVFGRQLLELFGSVNVESYLLLCLLAFIQTWCSIHHISSQLLNLTGKQLIPTLTFFTGFVSYTLLACVLLPFAGLLAIPIALGTTQLYLRLWIAYLVMKKLSLRVYGFFHFSLPRWFTA
jgi:O-antigen/teichoic acid export membrane protein